jgi:hypothetical protein
MNYVARPRKNEKPREGRPGFVIRLEPEIVERLRMKVGPSSPGRGGGIAHYLRCLVFDDLGLPTPSPYAHRPSPRKLARQRVKLSQFQQQWVQSEAQRRGQDSGDLVEGLIHDACRRQGRSAASWEEAWAWLVTEAIRLGTTTDRLVQSILNQAGAPT